MGGRVGCGDVCLEECRPVVCKNVKWYVIVWSENQSSEYQSSKKIKNKFLIFFLYFFHAT